MQRNFGFTGQMMLAIEESTSLVGKPFELTVTVDDDRIARALLRVDSREHVLGVDNLRVMLGESAFEKLREIVDV